MNNAWIQKALSSVAFGLWLPFWIYGQYDASIPYDLIELGDTINTHYHESAPIVTPDGSRLYFFVSDHPENHDHHEKTQDIWYSEKDEAGYWGKAIHMELPLNNHQFNQVFTILDEGRTLFIRGGSSRKAKGFSFTFFDGKNWSKPEEIDIESYDDMNRGIFSGGAISQDRQRIILYFNERSGKQISDLYLSERQSDGKYAKPVKIEALSTYKDEFNPYLSNNDKVLYFASDRPGTMGSADIWISRRLDDSWLNWSEPENIGAPINTRQFDAYLSFDRSGKNGFTTRAFVTPDGSNLDIFGVIPQPLITVTGKILDSLTKQPVAMEVVVQIPGEPGITFRSDEQGDYRYQTYKQGEWVYYGIKTDYKELEDTLYLESIRKDTTIIKNLEISPKRLEIVLYGFVTDAENANPLSATVNARGVQQDVSTSTDIDEGYFRMGLTGSGNYELLIESTGYEPYRKTISVSVEKGTYFTEIQQDAALNRIMQPYVITGYTYDEKTNQPISVDLVLDRADTTITRVSSDESGFFRVNVVRPGTFSLRGSKTGYLNSENQVLIADNQNFLEYNMDLYLKPIEIGVTVIIKNIYFDFDKTTLKRESFPELDRMTKLMLENPGMTIQISGHTDDKGSDQYNQQLSQGRAESVLQYLVDNGIDETRMKAVGFGESKPIATNSTDEGRAENRRVEFTILSK
jgi:outer membrane protein OmpA-like peptidoglycan-associated protein